MSYKRISGTSDKKDVLIKIAVPVIGVGAAYFLIVKPLLIKLGLLPNPQEQAANQSDQQAADNQADLFKVWSNNVNHTYTQTELDAIAVTLRNSTTDWWGYKWPDLAASLPHFTGMTVGDARYFLGTFVTKNGFTLYQWWLQKFQNADIIYGFSWDWVYWQPGTGGSGIAYDYRLNYARFGINEGNAGTYSWKDVVKVFVDYVYKVAGVTEQ
jgi:hypothetical protein